MSMKQEVAISPVGTVEYMAPEVTLSKITIQIKPKVTSVCRAQKNAWTVEQACTVSIGQIG